MSSTYGQDEKFFKRLLKIHTVYFDIMLIPLDEIKVLTCLEDWLNT